MYTYKEAIFVRIEHLIFILNIDVLKAYLNLKYLSTFKRKTVLIADLESANSLIFLSVQPISLKFLF